MTDAWIFPDWPAPAQVHAVVTTRDGPGVSAPPFGRFNLGLRSGEAVDVVASNRGVLQQAMNLPGTPRWLQQVHGSTVAELGPLPGEREPQADAAVSRIPGTVLAILTADCLPVLFCDRAGSVVAAAHAGWRGLADGVLEATVAAMQVPPDRILAWVGAAIGPQAFEVGDEVREAFVDWHPEAAAAFVPQPVPGKWLADLYQLARIRLNRIGVQAIHGGGRCTFSETDVFFSYRRDGVTGRMASLIWLT